MECYILSATCQACVSVVCSLQHITNRFRTEQVATGCNHKCNRRQSVAYSFGSVHAKSTWYEDRFRSGCSQKRQKNRTGPDFKTLADRPSKEGLTRVHLRCRGAWRGATRICRTVAANKMKIQGQQGSSKRLG